MAPDPTASPDPDRTSLPRRPGTFGVDSPLQTGGEARTGPTTAIAAMYFGYAMFMVLRTVPAVAGVAIRSDATLGIDLTDWGKIVAMGASGTVCGKLLCAGRRIGSAAV